MWPSLRAAGVTDCLSYEEPFLADLMSPLIRDDSRVMIGGAADPGFLCAIARICAAHRPRFTVIDRCGAGLELIREFADERRLACRTLKRDLLDLDGSEQWDVIALHYILDFMTPDLRRPFFASLARSLADGGTLVTVGMTAAKVDGDPASDLGAVFLGFASTALRSSPLAEHARSAEFEHMLRGYAAAWGRRRRNTLTGEEQLALLQSAGLRVVSETVVPGPPRRSGSATIVATRSIIVAAKR
jgi:hypothetical protein